MVIGGYNPPLGSGSPPGGSPSKVPADFADLLDDLDMDDAHESVAEPLCASNGAEAASS